MKLLIILSVIACSHAAKLDRTYLPPASAATAGGSSDSLRTPVSSSGASGNFGSSRPTGSFAPSGSSGSFAPSGSSGSFAPSGSSGSFTPSGSPGSLAPSGSSGSFAPSGSSGSYAPSGSSGPQFGLANNGAFGKTSGALNQPSSPSSQYGQPTGTSFDTGFAQPAQNFGNQAQNFGKPTGALNQPSAPSSQYGQPAGTSFDTGFAQPAQNFGNQAQNFGNQAQNYQRNQVERAQASADRNAEILRFDNQNDGETFSYNFETSNGIAAEESGVATNGVQAQGAYSYSDDDGQVFRVAYTADENGFQPQGEHLPTPHPIPEEILKSIEQNARAAAAGTQEGAYNPEEDNSPSSPQEYNNNAQPSYYQGPARQSNAFNQGATSSSGAFNQVQGKAPSQTYGAPNTASPSRIQGPQGPSQQYGAPTASFSPQSQGSAQQFGASSGPLSRPQVFPSSAQQYNAPNAGSSSRLQGPSQQYGAPNDSPSKSNSFQGPSQPYGAPNAGSAIGQSSFNQPQSKTPSANYGSPSNGAASSIAPSAPRQSGFTSAQAVSNQYQTRPNQYSRPQGPTSSGQAQDESGYQYNQPQGSFGNGPSGQAQYRPQIGASQGSQGVKPAEPFRPGSQSSQNYDAAAGPNTVGPKGNFGSTSQTSFGSPARPNAPAFGQLQGQSFNQGISRPGPSQMSESGYQYNQPQGSQNFGSRGPQSGSKTFPNQGQTFGAPRQPPSFTEEEGYKY